MLWSRVLTELRQFIQTDNLQKPTLMNFFLQNYGFVFFTFSKPYIFFTYCFLKLLKFKTKGKPLVCSIVLKNKSHPYMWIFTEFRLHYSEKIKYRLYAISRGVTGSCWNICHYCHATLIHAIHVTLQSTL